MFRNGTVAVCFALILVSGVCNAQKTWWGEVAGVAGGGSNDIFRFQELEGTGSVTGKGYWTGGVEIRRLFGDHFSLGTGILYSHQYYFTSPAPMIGGEDRHASLGLVTAPVTVRAGFLKYLFADAGAVFAVQTSSSDVDDMTGLGTTFGAGVQYKFKSDLFITVRAYATQYGLLHFIPENYPQTLLNSGVTFCVGYRFIRLGSCNCPDDKNPVRKFR